MEHRSTTNKGTITLTTLRWAPPVVHGLVRDLRVRWALEEVGLAYDVKQIGPDEQRSGSYRAAQPFGQVPVYEEDGLSLFESGAIVLHIAEKSEALMPRDADGRARAIAWMFAAIDSVEPALLSVFEVDFINAQAEWAKARRPVVVGFARSRLASLAARLEGREFLEDRFTAGDLLMAAVLRIVRHTDLVAEQPALEAYRLRCEARPAFQRALAAHMKAFGEAAGARG